MVISAIMGAWLDFYLLWDITHKICSHKHDICWDIAIRILPANFLTDQGLLLVLKQLIPSWPLFYQCEYWILAEPCLAGQSLDQSIGCQNCPEDHWSAAGNTAATCTACPSGKGVASGLGTQASDCTWSKLTWLFLFFKKQKTNSPFNPDWSCTHIHCRIKTIDNYCRSSDFIGLWRRWNNSNYWQWSFQRNSLPWKGRRYVIWNKSFDKMKHLTDHY